MKIFCIGFNKTGTTSLHAFFNSLGLRSYHGMYNEWNINDPRFGEYDCFSDGNHHDFIELDQNFLNSKFILTSRRLDNWLISRVRHIEIRRMVNKSGWMRKEYEANPRRALERWITFRAPYYERVFSYFSNRPTDLFCLNICDGELNQKQNISRLLTFLSMPPNAAVELPHERNTDRISHNMGRGVRSVLFRKKKPRSKSDIRIDIESTLQEIGIPESEWAADGLSDWRCSPAVQAGTASMQK
jgi:hypothetical protein